MVTIKEQIEEFAAICGKGSGAKEVRLSDRSDPRGQRYVLVEIFDKQGQKIGARRFPAKFADVLEKLADGSEEDEPRLH
jgi:hypothetical protein